MARGASGCNGRRCPSVNTKGMRNVPRSGPGGDRLPHVDARRCAVLDGDNIPWKITGAIFAFESGLIG